MNSQAISNPHGGSPGPDTQDISATRERGLSGNVRVVASGLGFTEGPCADGPDHLLVASINRGSVYRVPLDLNETPELAFECGGGPNGLAIGKDGSVFVAQNGGTAMPTRSQRPATPSVQRWRNEELATLLDTSVTAPSDCVVGPDGRLWFTDPGDHEIFSRGAPGHLRSLDTATGELRTWLSGLAFPNGLAFGPTGSELYVAETSARTVSRYRLSDKGLEADGWTARIRHGHPDGIALDAAGWLWVAGSTGHNILAFDTAGELCHEIDFGPGMLVTSLCFGGPGLSMLYVTSPKGGSLLEIPAVHPGLPLPVFRKQPLLGIPAGTSS